MNQRRYVLNPQGDRNTTEYAGILHCFSVSGGLLHGQRKQVFRVVEGYGDSLTALKQHGLEEDNA